MRHIPWRVTWLSARFVGIGLLAICLATSSAILAIAQTAPQETVLDAGTQQTIQDQVVAIRGLYPQGPVNVQFLPDADLAAHLAQVSDADPPDPDRTEAGLDVLALLSGVGRAPWPDTDLASALAPRTTGALGMYVPAEQTIYMVDDRSTDPMTSVVYAHEYTHALQDQDFGTGAYEAGLTTADARLAYDAVQEGDATFTELLWATFNLDPDTVSGLQLSWAQEGEQRVGVETWARQSQTDFVYGAGTALVRDAVQRAGGSMSGIDGLYARPPVSTAQVLHPEQYWSNEQPLDVTLPNVAGALGPDWRVLYTDVMGELGLGMLLQLSVPPSTASASVVGWRGDRWQVLENGDQAALVMRSEWDDAPSAQRFFDALTHHFRTTMSRATQTALSPTRQLLSGGRESTDLWRSGSEVTLVAASSADDVAAAERVLGSQP